MMTSEEIVICHFFFVVVVIFSLSLRLKRIVWCHLNYILSLGHVEAEMIDDD